jgi:hypothetical protein
MREAASERQETFPRTVARVSVCFTLTEVGKAADGTNPSFANFISTAKTNTKLSESISLVPNECWVHSMSFTSNLALKKIGEDLNSRVESLPREGPARWGREARAR